MMVPLGVTRLVALIFRRLISPYSGTWHFLQSPADRHSERNKSSNGVFETLRKETTLPGENVKYISSSRLFRVPPLTMILHRGGTQIATDASNVLKKDVSNISGSEAE
jgi:hypothetical protein